MGAVLVHDGVGLLSTGSVADSHQSRPEVDALVGVLGLFMRQTMIDQDAEQPAGRRAVMSTRSASQASSGSSKTPTAIVLRCIAAASPALGPGI
jgi:hypothetical protein